MIEKAGVDINIHLTLNRREAIKDADFVTTQFRVGLLEARIRDEKIPLKYNCIGQETTGAGGLAKALRTIPVILGICRGMESAKKEGTCGELVKKVEAGVHGDYDAALQALILHPLVESSIAKPLLDDIIRENIDYLPQFKHLVESGKISIK